MCAELGATSARSPRFESARQRPAPGVWQGPSKICDSGRLGRVVPAHQNPAHNHEMDLQPGQIVRVRSRKYLVEGVVPPSGPADCPLVRLSCVEDDALGEQLEVLWDTEVDARVVDGANWQAIASRGFDEPRLFSAYLNTLRWNCVTSTNPRLFQAPYRAASR